MAKKEFTYRGMKEEELKTLDVDAFKKIVPASIRRNLNRGFTDAQKVLLKNLRAGANNVKTHCRDIPVLPEMVGIAFAVHNGKEFIPVMIEPEMMGHYLGELMLTRKRVTHSSPGVGSTKSSSALSVK